MLCLCTQYIIYIAGKVRHLYVHMFKLCGRNVNFVNYDASVIFLKNLWTTFFKRTNPIKKNDGFIKEVYMLTKICMTI